MKLVVTIALLCLIQFAFGIDRVYYIAAEEVMWNYGPTGMNNVDGLPLDQSPHSGLYFAPPYIGGTYIKAQYIEYTDSSFNERKQRTVAENHLGLQGPVLRAEVGDTIIVHYKNNIEFNTTMHVHGLFATKEFEGTYVGGVIDGHDYPGNHVQPGETFTYKWYVPSRAGPGRSDFSSVAYSYHSYYNFEEDVNAGLIGSIVVTKKGYAKLDGSPVDVDREYFIYYSVFDETESFYFEKNVEHFIPEQANDTALLSSFIFGEANLKRAVNGFLFANIPDVKMKTQETVRWYITTLGAERDVHTAFWDGQTLVNVQGIRVASEIVFPARSNTLTMFTDQVGEFFFQCHVNTHFTAGMTGIYIIEEGEDYNHDRNFATSFDAYDIFRSQTLLIESSSASSNIVCLCFLVTLLILL